MSSSDTESAYKFNRISLHNYEFMVAKTIDYLKVNTSVYKPFKEKDLKLIKLMAYALNNGTLKTIRT